MGKSVSVPKRHDLCTRQESPLENTQWTVSWSASVPIPIFSSTDAFWTFEDSCFLSIVSLSFSPNCPFRSPHTLLLSRHAIFSREYERQVGICCWVTYPVTIKQNHGDSPWPPWQWVETRRKVNQLEELLTNTDINTTFFLFFLFFSRQDEKASKIQWQPFNKREQKC